MKRYLFLFALIFTSYSYSFQITGESFKAKFEKRSGNFDNLPKKITKIN